MAFFSMMLRIPEYLLDYSRILAACGDLALSFSLRADDAADARRYVELIWSTDWAQIPLNQALRRKELPNRLPDLFGSAGDFFLFDHATGDYFSVVAARSGRDVSYAPVNSPFHFPERRFSVGECVNLSSAGSGLPHPFLLDPRLSDLHSLLY